MNVYLKNLKPAYDVVDIENAFLLSAKICLDDFRLKLDRQIKINYHMIEKIINTMGEISNFVVDKGNAPIFGGHIKTTLKDIINDFIIKVDYEGRQVNIDTNVYFLDKPFDISLQFNQCDKIKKRMILSELKTTRNELASKQWDIKQQKHKGDLYHQSHFQHVANTTRIYLRDLEKEINSLKQELKNAI